MRKDLGLLPDRWAGPSTGRPLQADRATLGPVASGPCSGPCHGLGVQPEARTTPCYGPARARLSAGRASFGPAIRAELRAGMKITARMFRYSDGGRSRGWVESSSGLVEPWKARVAYKMAPPFTDRFLVRLGHDDIGSHPLALFLAKIIKVTAHCRL